MKKLSRIWPFLFALAACHTPENKRAKEDWSDYSKGYSFLSKNADSAFYYFNRSASLTPDKKQAGLAYFNMATLQSDAGDYYGTQESLTLSLKALDPRDTSVRQYIAGDYNELGVTLTALNDPVQALAYYRRALTLTSDLSFRSIILNNEGIAYKDHGQFIDALKSYSAALQLANKDSLLYARVLTNMATVRSLRDKNYNAAPEFFKALAIRDRLKDGAGANSSYAHLTDYYTSRQPDSAIGFAHKLLVSAGRLNDGDDQMHALHALMMLSPAGQSKTYFQRYQLINDSITRKRNAAKNQFALIRYNVAQQQAANIQLQKQNTLKAYQLAALACICLIGGVTGYWLYRLNQRRLGAEAAAALQHSRLQLSQKVHDKVANGIYRIISEIEHKPELEKEELLDKLDHIYGISRDITHDAEELNEADFTNKLSAMLYDLKPAAVKLALSGNEPELWAQVSLNIRGELELILQELMVNMSKHSGATQALLAFAIKPGELAVDYRDNGVGMKPKQKPGKGLQHTVSRIEALKGHIKFDDQQVNGFSVHLQVPLDQ